MISTVVLVLMPTCFLLVERPSSRPGVSQGLIRPDRLTCCHREGDKLCITLAHSPSLNIVTSGQALCIVTSGQALCIVTSGQPLCIVTSGQPLCIVDGSMRQIHPFEAVHDSTTEGLWLLIGLLI